MIGKQIYYAMVRKGSADGTGKEEYIDNETIELDGISAQISGQKRDKEFECLSRLWPTIRLARIEIKEVGWPEN